MKYLFASNNFDLRYVRNLTNYYININHWYQSYLNLTSTSEHLNLVSISIIFFNCIKIKIQFAIAYVIRLYRVKPNL